MALAKEMSSASDKRDEYCISAAPFSQPSEIRQYFKGAKIFLTGATGFIGKLIIEKILRSCPDVDKVFVLIRNKKGKDINTRLQELFDGVIFEGLKKTNPSIFKKITAVSGDCSLPNLGFSDEFKKTLRQDVNCIIHCAATVRFDEPLPSAVNINVRSTRDLIEMAKSMENLEGFIYVSTAYCFCPRKTLDEVFYEPPISAEKLLTIAQSLNESTLKKITPSILGKWPNTYTLTKAVAEGIAKDAADELPLAVVRPSIVIGTVKEPMEGWIDNLYGPTGVVIGAYTGLMRTLHCNPKNLADMVPADFVANETIAVAWDVGRKVRERNSKKGKQFQPLNGKVTAERQVFNCVSSVDNPITWRKYMEILQGYGRDIPTMYLVWYYWFNLNPNRFVHLLFQLLFQTLPAYAVDTILFLLGRKPRLVAIYKKVDKFSNVLAYFCMRQWIFTNKNTCDLWNEMNDQDKQIFPFHMNLFKWEKLLLAIMKGGRVYLLKDPMDTLEESRRKSFYYKIAHYFVVTITLLLFIKLFIFVMHLINY